MIGTVVYNIWLHPLSKFPGPKLYAASGMPSVIESLRGRYPQTVQKLHKKYGPIVRTAPNELSFIDAQAWKDIYGLRQDHQNFQKDPEFYTVAEGFSPNILTAN